MAQAMVGMKLAEVLGVPGYHVDHTETIGELLKELPLRSRVPSGKVLSAGASTMTSVRISGFKMADDGLINMNRV